MRDDWLDGAPPPEAYGRVTDPGRFRVLHAAADALAAELADRFVVEVSADVPPPVDLVDRLPRVQRTVGLVPDGGGAPVTLLYTLFPGLVVRYGRWCTDLAPVCGCDACDDDPAELVGELMARVRSVARDGFHESRAFRRRGIDVWYRFTGVGSMGGWSAIDDDDERRRLEAAGTGTVDWPPWRVRSSR
jgi:Family of unknown function (DUF6226)